MIWKDILGGRVAHNDCPKYKGTDVVCGKGSFNWNFLSLCFPIQMNEDRRLGQVVNTYSFINYPFTQYHIFTDDHYSNSIMEPPRRSIILTARPPRTYNWMCYCLWFGEGTIKWSTLLLLWFLCASGVINYILIDFIGTIKSFHEAQGRLPNDTYFLPQSLSEEYSMTTMTTLMVCQNRKEDILEFPFQ